MSEIMYVTGWNHIIDMFYIDRYAGNRKTNRVLYNTQKQMLRAFSKIRKTIEKERQP